MIQAALDRDGVLDMLRRVSDAFPAALGAAQMVRESVTLSGAIVVHKKLPIGQAALVIDVTAAGNGGIELDIRSATVFGSSLFGMVRKMAGDMIVKQVSAFSWLRAVKAPNGNIWISLPGVRVVSAAVSDRLAVQFDLA